MAGNYAFVEFMYPAAGAERLEGDDLVVVERDGEDRQSREDKPEKSYPGPNRDVLDASQWDVTI
ncbi:MAG TPA: hypothetical protein VMM78_12725 [Thermomicrobiales bacterium]|nr:hypothetical protein [Thermomicrobiales bacterium]